MLLDPSDVPAGAASWGSVHRTIDEARKRLNMSPEDLRIAAWGFGGNARSGKLREYLDGRAALDEQNFNSLVAAVNDRFTELGLSPSLPYSEDFHLRSSSTADGS